MLVDVCSVVVVSLNFFFWNIFFYFLYLYIEVCISLVYFSLLKSLKFYKLVYLKKTNINIYKGNLFIFINNLLFIFILTLKLKLNNNVITYFILYPVISLFTIYLKHTNIAFISFNVFFFSFFFFFINNLFSFFLFIELYSVFFFFFFLNFNNKLYSFFIQYKNNVLNYLFNNFFISIFFLFSISIFSYFFGTLNFYEINCLMSKNNTYSFFFIIISFFFKLGLPGFHFLKIEIYKHLNFNILILYSVITLYINYQFMIFFFNHLFIYFLLLKFKFIILLLIISVFSYIYKLKINNTHEFFAFSSFITNNLIVVNFIFKYEFFF